MICSEGTRATTTLDHQVVELADMSASNQHWLRRDDGRIHFNDVSVTGPMVYPGIHDFALNPRTHGSVIYQPGNSTVQLE